MGTSWSIEVVISSSAAWEINTLGMLIAATDNAMAFGLSGPCTRARLEATLCRRRVIGRTMGSVPGTCFRRFTSLAIVAS